jgi:hypothetical protein
MIEDSATTMEMLQRRVQLEAVMRRVMEELALIPLTSPYTLFGIRDDVEWEPRRDSMIRLFDVGRRGSDR